MGGNNLFIKAYLTLVFEKKKNMLYMYFREAENDLLMIYFSKVSAVRKGRLFLFMSSQENKCVFALQYHLYSRLA